MNKVFTIFRESQLARFLIPAGIILIIFGCATYSINSKNQNYLPIESTVLSVELVEAEHTDADGNVVPASYDVTVKYNVKDVDYEGVLPNVGKYKEGDKIKIYYNPEDPNQITQTKSLIIPIASMVLGIAALVGGIVSGANTVKRMKKMEEQEKGWAK